MTEMLKYFEEGQVLRGVRLGLISMSQLERYDIYLKYLDLCKNHTSTEVRKILMIKNDCDNSVLSKILDDFEGKNRPDQRRKNGSFKVLQQTPNGKPLLLK